MGTRPGTRAWMLALLTATVVLSASPAFAVNFNGQPRAEGAGWAFIKPADIFANQQEIKFGFTAMMNTGASPEGRFEYLNTATGLNLRGRITGWSLVANTCPDAPTPTAPAAHLTGNCDDGSNCYFSIDVVDGGSPGKGNDWFCHLNVSGTDRNGSASSDNDISGSPLLRGNINIH